MGFEEIRRSVARPAVLTAGLFAIAFGYYTSYASHGNIVPDEAWLLDGCMRVLDGQVPHRDFSNIYAPARYYLFGAVFGLTEGSLLAIRLTWCLLCAGVVALTFLVARRMMPAGFALAAAGAALVLPGPWHKTLYSLVPLLALYPVARWLETGHRRWLIAAGLAGSVGTWLRQDVGLFVLLTAGSLIVLAALGRLLSLRRGAAGGDAGQGGGAASLYGGIGRAGLARTAAGDALALTLPAVLVFGAGLALLAAAGAAGDFLQQAFVQSMSEGSPRGRLLLQALGFGIRGFSPPAAQIVALLCWIPPLLAVPALVLAGRRALAGQAGAADGLLWCVGLCGLAACNQVLRRDVLIRFLQCAPFVILLWFTAGGVLYRRVRPGAGGRAATIRRAAALALVLVPVAALAAYVHGSGENRKLPVEYTGSLATRWHRAAPFQVRGRTYYFSEQSLNNTEQLLRFLEEHTRPGEPFLVLGKPASLYYLTGRISPLPAIRVGDSAIRPQGPERVHRAALRSGLRYVIAEHRFVRGRGRLWQGFLNEHGQVVARNDSHAIWDIGS